jgi:hypothetical protein
MHLLQIDRLTSTVPAGADPRQRRRLNAYRETARRCERRIQFLREEVERALTEQEESASPEGGETPEPNRVLTLVCELHTLEQVQPRVDGWLKDQVSALVSQEAPPGFADAEVYGDAPM